MCASHFRLQLTTNQLCSADGPIGRNSKRTVRSITFVLPPTASHNISTSSGCTKSVNPQLSSSSCGYCFAVVSHWLWLLIFPKSVFFCRNRPLLLWTLHTVQWSTDTHKSCCARQEPKSYWVSENVFSVSTGNVLPWHTAASKSLPPHHSFDTKKSSPSHYTYV